VSGEYSRLKFAGRAGVIDYERVMMETNGGLQEGRSRYIISYHAKEVAEILSRG